MEPPVRATWRSRSRTRTFRRGAARLEAAGVAIESEVTWPRGGRSLYIRDPAGNCVELASPKLWGFEDPEDA